jgi:hypothetical protein
MTIHELLPPQSTVYLATHSVSRTAHYKTYAAYALHDGKLHNISGSAAEIVGIPLNEDGDFTIIAGTEQRIAKALGHNLRSEVL